MVKFQALIAGALLFGSFNAHQVINGACNCACQVGSQCPPSQVPPGHQLSCTSKPGNGVSENSKHYGH